MVLGPDFFNFKFNHRPLHGLKAVWGPVVCRPASFNTGNHLRDSRFALLNHTACREDVAGWHSSFLTASDNVIAKLENHVHQEENVQKRRDISVADLIANPYGLMDRCHPGSVSAVVALELCGCPPLEQLIAKHPSTTLLDS